MGVPAPCKERIGDITWNVKEYTRNNKSEVTEMKIKEIALGIAEELKESIIEDANRKWTKKDTICSIVSVILSAATSAIVVLLCTK